MWFKIKVFPCDQKIIFLPAVLAKVCGPTAAVKFGGKSIGASVQFRDDLELSRENSFETPGKVVLSDKLRDELLIAEIPIYQLQISEAQIAFGPVIGLLLGNATHRYNPQHMTKYTDRFGIYHQIGGLVYAFSPKHINWQKHTAYGLYYNYAAGLWEYGCFPLPEVIYRRDFHTDPEMIKRLVKFTGGRLFNSYRFSKYEFFDYFRLDRELKNHLPPTEYAQEINQIKRFINLHKKVILKPVHLSRGRGICIIDKVESQYRVYDFRTKQPTVYELYNDELFEGFFDVYQDLFDQYLMQKYIPFSKIGDSPFDIRVVMQKRPDGQWECSGMECRVSNNGYLTNISRGGYALPLSEALKQAYISGYELLEEQINELSQKFCLFLDRSGEHFAELGLDIAFDTEKKLWLIEANVFPSFKGFKKMDLDTYLDIRYHPMLYACSLTQFSISASDTLLGGEGT